MVGGASRDESRAWAGSCEKRELRRERRLPFRPPGHHVHLASASTNACAGLFRLNSFGWKRPSRLRVLALIVHGSAPS